MPYRLGIDAGSKTLKCVAFNEDGNAFFSSYERHESNFLQSLERALADLEDVTGSATFDAAITGSAGLSLSHALGIPFVQEVIATTCAVTSLFPDADAAIELGGEDAKIIYTSGTPEQRMNATCASGTGGFIDNVSYLLGINASEFEELAGKPGHIHPIASRCAVFAQSDIKSLLNSGAVKGDIAKSSLYAVAKQVISGLSCGRPLTGKVLLLGGPAEYFPTLVKAFEETLKPNECDVCKPENAHLVTAYGAALMSGNEFHADVEHGKVLTLAEIRKRIPESLSLDESMERLEPLFDSAEEMESFRKRHSRDRFPSRPIKEAKGDLFVGIDAGSTTVKIAVIESEKNLIWSGYEPTGGDTLEAVRKMLLDFYGAVRLYSCPGDLRIAHCTVTGYGEELVKAAFSADSGVVETAAHLRAAAQMHPEVSFVLDIGGQDMKALWVRDGQIVDAVLNDACSSGCGAALVTTAHSLNLEAEDFSRVALYAKSPIDLGTKCTVFMNSRVINARVAGISSDDIAAGVAYSVLLNPMTRIMGIDKEKHLGH
ncbi:MAG: hypothetical protein LUB61_07730 [Eggerthellaceae bacterium]|nr:hypothetical protein [Eggerthellaceae bacterium]